MREAGRPGEATHLARGAVALQPNQPEGRLVLSSALREMGRGRASEHAQLEARLDVNSPHRHAAPRRAASEQPHAASLASSAAASAAVKPHTPALSRARVSAAACARSAPTPHTWRPRGALARRSPARRVAIFCRKVYSGRGPMARGTGALTPSPRHRRLRVSGHLDLGQLVALGWGVEVYANPSLADTGLDARGVLWLPHWAYGLGESPRARLPTSLATGGGAASRRRCESSSRGASARRWRWGAARRGASCGCTTRSGQRRCPRRCCRCCTASWSSAFHCSQLPDHAKPLGFAANGLDAAAIRAGPTRTTASSTPRRPAPGCCCRRSCGRAFGSSCHPPRCTYYGFWPYAMWEEQPQLRKLRAQIEPLLAAPGVEYGMVSEAEPPRRTPRPAGTRTPATSPRRPASR